MRKPVETNSLSQKFFVTQSFTFDRKLRNKSNFLQNLIIRRDFQKLNRKTGAFFMIFFMLFR